MTRELSHRELDGSDELYRLEQGAYGAERFTTLSAAVLDGTVFALVFDSGAD